MNIHFIFLLYFFFSRCFDDILITWNESKDDAQSWIEKINMKHRSIQVQSCISTDVDYLDANISWNNDYSDDGHKNAYQLETSVCHQSKSEPYALPYIGSDPLPMIYSRLFRSALIRAVLTCSDVYQFELERQYIESSFTLNRFSSRFIHLRIILFFREFGIDTLYFYRHRSTVYDELRHRLIAHDRKQREKNFSI